MDNNIERAVLRDRKRIVVKVGTTSLTYPNGRMDLKRMQSLSWVLTDLRSQGRDVVLVSSGAIAVGADRLGLGQRPRDTIGKQAASAVGQAALMQIYENFFLSVNQKVAQILLTKDVLDDETRKTHARNTFFALFAMGVIPIVNENDTIAIDELGFSENDTLAAYVACLVESDCLIFLSDSDGLYDKDPRTDALARRISRVDRIDDAVYHSAGEAGTDLGTGGMAAKVSAAAMATEAGIDALIASGEEPTILFRLLHGDELGTWFPAKAEKG